MNKITVIIPIWIIVFKIFNLQILNLSKNHITFFMKLCY